MITDRRRLAIISALAVNPSLRFSELTALLNVTDGNLSVHARKLEDEKLIQCKKTIVNRMPKSIYQSTKTGQRTLEQYLCEMEALIRSVRKK